MIFIDSIYFLECRAKFYLFLLVHDIRKTAGLGAIKIISDTKQTSIVSVKTSCRTIWPEAQKFHGVLAVILYSNWGVDVWEISNRDDQSCLWKYSKVFPENTKKSLILEVNNALKNRTEKTVKKIDSDSHFLSYEYDKVSANTNP